MVLPSRTYTFERRSRNECDRSEAGVRPARSSSSISPRGSGDAVRQEGRPERHPTTRRVRWPMRAIPPTACARRPAAVPRKGAHKRISEKLGFLQSEIAAPQRSHAEFVTIQDALGSTVGRTEEGRRSPPGEALGSCRETRTRPQGRPGAPSASATSLALPSLIKLVRDCMSGCRGPLSGAETTSRAGGAAILSCATHSRHGGQEPGTAHHAGPVRLPHRLRHGKCPHCRGTAAGRGVRSRPRSSAATARRRVRHPLRPPGTAVGVPDRRSEQHAGRPATGTDAPARCWAPRRPHGPRRAGGPPGRAARSHRHGETQVRRRARCERTTSRVPLPIARAAVVPRTAA